MWHERAEGTGSATVSDVDESQPGKGAPNSIEVPQLGSAGAAARAGVCLRSNFEPMKRLSPRGPRRLSATLAVRTRRVYDRLSGGLSR